MTKGSTDFERVLRIILQESLAISRETQQQNTQKPMNSETTSSDTQTTLPFSSSSTSVESQKLNEATELIKTFCNTSPASSDVSTLIPSMFNKFDGFFSDDDPRVHPNSKASSCSSMSSDGTIHSDIHCICFNCWGPVAAGSSKSKTWKSPDQAGFPILPVFVKSPLDSLKLYGETEEKTQGILISPISSTEASSTPPTVDTTEKNSLQLENELLQKKIRLQNEIIQKLIELTNISEKLVKNSS